MKKLPLIILLATLSSIHITACAEEDVAGKSATAESKPTSGEAAPAADAKPAEGEAAPATADAKPAEGEIAPAADAKPAEGEKKSVGGEEPDCN